MGSIKKEIQQIKTLLEQNQCIEQKYNDLTNQCRKLDDFGQDTLINDEFKEQIINKIPKIRVPSQYTPLLNKYLKKKNKIWDYENFHINIRSDQTKETYDKHAYKYKLVPKAEVEFQLEISSDYTIPDYWEVNLLQNSSNCKKDYGFNKNECLEELSANVNLLDELLTDKNRFIELAELEIKNAQREKKELDEYYKKNKD